MENIFKYKYTGRSSASSCTVLVAAAAAAAAATETNWWLQTLPLLAASLEPHRPLCKGFDRPGPFCLDYIRQAHTRQRTLHKRGVDFVPAQAQAQ
jgi:hypothetical protein